MKKSPPPEIKKVDVGNHIEVMYHPVKEWVRIYHHDEAIKQVSFENNATEKKVVIVEIAEMGANVAQLALALHVPPEHLQLSGNQKEL